MINTNQYAAATVAVTITVGFANSLYTAQLTTTVNVAFFHPCKQTVITSSQTIPVLQHMFGDPALQYTF
jgi:hypothetical protein